MPEIVCDNSTDREFVRGPVPQRPAMRLLRNSRHTEAFAKG
jgi:hypothetical protein